MENWKVSIIIPMYNASKTIIKCLDSVVNQLPINMYEIVIVAYLSDASVVRVALVPGVALCISTAIVVVTGVIPAGRIVTATFPTPA